MPYITKDKRRELDPIVEQLRHALASMEMDDELNNTEGNLNYFITKILMQIYGDKNSTSYAQINDAIGLLDCAKMEFYRKVAGPYEDKKEIINGEVTKDSTPVPIK